MIITGIRHIFKKILCKIVCSPSIEIRIGQVACYIQLPLDVEMVQVQELADYFIHEFEIISICNSSSSVKLLYRIKKADVEMGYCYCRFPVDGYIKKNYQYLKTKNVHQSFGVSGYLISEKGKIQIKERRTCTMKMSDEVLNPLANILDDEEFEAISLGSGRSSGLGIFNICEIKSTSMRFVYLENYSK